MKTFVKTLGPQNNQICDKIPIESYKSTMSELSRPTQVTDMSDITVENLWVKLSFKALPDDRRSQTTSLSIGIVVCSGVSRKKNCRKVL